MLEAFRVSDFLFGPFLLPEAIFTKLGPWGLLHPHVKTSIPLL